MKIDEIVKALQDGSSDPFAKKTQTPYFTFGKDYFGDKTVLLVADENGNVLMEHETHNGGSIS